MAIREIGDAAAWLRPLVNIGAMTGLASVVLVLLLGQSRIFYAVAVDLLPQALCRIGPRRNTPLLSIVIVGGTAASIAALFPIRLLGELVSIGTLFAFFVVSCGVLVLRAKELVGGNS